MYAEVVFPLPFRNSFTYEIPDELEVHAQIGVRVVVPFGKRVLTGFIINILETTNVESKIKKVKDVLDSHPIFTKDSLKFYEWISDYYLSSLGEALKNSVPYGSKVESKRKVVADSEYCLQLYNEEKRKDTTKASILEILSEKESIKISTLQRDVGKKNIYSTLRQLEKKGALTIINEIEDAKVSVKTVKHVQLAKPVDEVYNFIPELESNSPKQVVIILELVSLKGESIARSELLKKTKSSQTSVKSLEQKGLVEVFDKEVERIYEDAYKEDFQKLTLTEPQKNIVEEVSKNVKEQTFHPYLLHGVTGSGKTQVYIELSKKAIEMGRTVLILVPEISLTPQITKRFFNTFGEKVTVMHSRMSMGERYDAWRNIISGKYRIVIGPRSSLFAPLKDIGFIVVDEEHDQSYKQYDLIPRYNARDSAVVRAQLSSCPIILGSATPSVESKYNSEIGKYTLVELKERIDNAKLPKIDLVNITIEKKKKMMENIFSKRLLTEISDRLKKNEGVIILQNRRGFATQVYCEDCGHIELCNECDVAMVHHIDKNTLKCHYCGFSKPVPRACTVCGSLALKFFGTGTQRVEDELEYYFPNIRMERVDSDSVRKKGKLGEILNRFRKGETDVLIGTQIVSKGLDFSNVTLVGVISAETTLWLPDFRADERTFQLLTQVSGRAGRSKVEGEVLIQTLDHKHFVLQRVLENDYPGFYRREIDFRKQGGYPPFTRLCLIEAKDLDEKKVQGAVNDFFKILNKYRKGIVITPPSPAIISRLKGYYRYQILTKSSKEIDPGGGILRKAIYNTFIEFNQKSRFREVRLFFDIDPQSII